jgi:putative glutamine amidotransferase
MHSIGATYTRAIHRAGGTQVMLPPVMQEADWPGLLQRLDGLLLSGGEDIAPEAYGQEREAWTGRVDEERDHAELGLVQRWLDLGKPLLAICRGHQVLNVALGGTLLQDVMTQHPNALDHAYFPGRPMENPVHEVEIQPESRLARILDDTRLAVNSAHHQAVAEPGCTLVVVARAPDDIIEATELPNHRYCISVQWHPEAMLKLSTSMLPLFRTFVEASA